MSILQQVPAKMQAILETVADEVAVNTGLVSENLPGVRWRKSSSSVGWKTQRRVISTSLKPCGTGYTSQPTSS